MNEKWELIKWRELQKGIAIELTPLIMTEIHRMGEDTHQPAWQLVRLIYGARRVGGDPLGRQVESVHTAAQITGLEQRKLAGILMALFDDFYKQHTGQDREGRKVVKFPRGKAGRPMGQRNVITELPPVTVDVTPGAPVPKEEAMFAPEAQLQSEDDILHHFGFNREIFDCEGRSGHVKLEEVKWFCQRLVELRKLFEENMTKSLARMAVINEMLLRRVDYSMTRVSVESEQFEELQKTKAVLEEKYASQWQQIDSIVPYAAAAQSKYSFAGVVSDMVEAVKLWQSKRDNRLVDGVFTKFEIEILTRASEQHEVRYRPSLVMAWLDAQRNFWNPKYKCEFPTRTLKVLDAGFREGARAANEKGDIFIPDIEKDGSEGEYLALGTGPLSMPTGEEEVEEVPVEVPVGPDGMVEINTQAQPAAPASDPAIPSTEPEAPTQPALTPQ